MLKDLKELNIKICNFAFPAFSFYLFLLIVKFFNIYRAISEYEYKLTLHFSIWSKILYCFLTLGWVSKEMAEVCLHKIDWQAM